MTTLIGQTVKVPAGYNKFRRILVISETEDRQFYNCRNLDLGGLFQAKKSLYDDMFIPKGNKDVKPLHYKGENPATIARHYKK